MNVKLFASTRTPVFSSFACLPLRFLMESVVSNFTNFPQPAALSFTTCTETVASLLTHFTEFVGLISTYFTELSRTVSRVTHNSSRRPSLAEYLDRHLGRPVPSFSLSRSTCDQNLDLHTRRLVPSSTSRHVRYSRAPYSSLISSTLPMIHTPSDFSIFI